MYNKHVNIIASNNKRTFVFLKEHGDFFVATIAVLIENMYSVPEKKIIGTQIITKAQKDELIEKKKSFESQGIFIIETPGSSETIILLDFINEKAGAPIGKTIPSPYFLKLFSHELTLSSQKTRGPNK